MSSKPVKLQVYIDTETYNELEKISKKDQISLSKTAAKMIGKGIQHDGQERFQIKTQSMLGHILSSVYDHEISQTNAQEVKDLINHIDTKVEEKLKG